MKGRILENIQLHPGIIPVDLASGAQNGDWVSMAHHGKCAVIYLADPGAAGQDVTLTFEQATANDGSGAKALNFTRHYVRSAANLQSGALQWTETEVAATNTYVNSAGGENQELVVVEFEANDLDIDNGFKFLRVSTSDPGATAGKLGCALYLFAQPRFSQRPEDMRAVNA